MTLGVSFSTLQESRLHGIVITYRNFTSRPLKDAICSVSFLFGILQMLYGGVRLIL